MGHPTSRRKLKKKKLRDSPVYSLIKDTIAAKFGKRTRAMWRNPAKNGKSLDPNEPVSVPIGKSAVEVLPSLKHILLKHTPGMFGFLRAAVTEDRPSVRNTCTDKYPIQNAFGPDDKQLMKDYNIKCWPSKRQLVCEPTEDGEKRIKISIKYNEKRRRTYSESKLKAYVQTKAQAALRKAVSAAQGQPPQSDVSDSPDGGESSYVDSSADA